MQTLVVKEEKLTGRLELAVAVSGTEAPRACPAIWANVMAWDFAVTVRVLRPEAFCANGVVDAKTAEMSGMPAGLSMT